LSMVLSILVGSGLLFHLPEEPEDRYQLVHDYLVRCVRQVQTPALMAELAPAQGEAQAAKRGGDRRAKTETDTALAAAPAAAPTRAGLRTGFIAAAGMMALVTAVILGIQARQNR
ncbi:MAG TPA: hypothetical protein V6D02_13780, partial [Candidatus Obscuribacterales bacterium]